MPVPNTLGIMLEPEDTNDLLQNLSFVLKETKVVLLVGPEFSAQKLKSALNL